MHDPEQTPLVLVVEDDPSIRLLMNLLLGQAGMRTVEAADGDAALSAALDHRPDVVLLDIGLPDVDGFTVLARLKAHRALADMPVIMVSAWVEAGQVERALNAGAHGYVRKPFEPAVLLERVREALGGGSRTRGPS